MTHVQATERDASQIAVYLSPEQQREELCKEVAAGLVGHPKELSPKWLYDEQGCELFEQITQLAEYYPTRT